MQNNWNLPDHIADVLPLQASSLEHLRRSSLDLFRSYGYELVAPPVIEYINSLLAGNAQALALQTCKFVDQLSGLTLGIRADITPQIARIDSHLLRHEGVTRLCYCGEVIHARPANLLADRELLQIGAEIYGCDDLQADIEIIELALATIRQAGISEYRLEINHPGIVQALVQSEPNLHGVADQITLLLNEKSTSELAILLAQFNISPVTAQALLQLPQLYGGLEVLERARKSLPPLPGINEALDTIEALMVYLNDSKIGLDLADLQGFQYHSGISFEIFAPQWHDALVRGGRYDHTSFALKKTRSATGFSLDLRKLVNGLNSLSNQDKQSAIKAPWLQDPSLREKIKELRNQGQVVVQVSSNSVVQSEQFIFSKELVQHQGQWLVVDCTNF